MKKIEYNKLVRNKIPEIIENDNKKPIIEVLDDEKYKKQLDLKLQEELDEYIGSDNVEELADLVEVIYGILAYKNIDLKDFEDIRLKKAEKRGSFNKRILLKEVIENYDE